MVFCTKEFLIGFFALAVLYAFCNLKLRKVLLFAANTIFYIYAGSYGFIYLFVSTVLSYLACRIKDKKAIIAVILLNIAGLACFKYVSLPESIMVPLGLSFFVFKNLSCLFETYKGTMVSISFFDYYLYVTFFAQVFAGPIERMKSFKEKLDHLDHAIEYKQLKTGFVLFIFGIFEKVIIASRMITFTDAILDHVSSYTGIMVLLGMIGYSFVIYMDFDAYSNMANGLCNMLGFDSVLNFHAPYLAYNLSDFWRRWHITLSSWFKDYVYIPLGGNKRRMYLNLFIVSVLSGLWHGNTLNFLIWGIGHGVAQIIGKWWHIHVSKNSGKNSLFKPFSILLTFFTVTFLWVFFRMEHFNDALTVFRQLFSFNHTIDLTALGISAFELKLTGLFFMLFILCDLFRGFTKGIETFNKIPFILRWIVYVFIIICFILLIDFNTGVEVTEFIYGQF